MGNLPGNYEEIYLITVMYNCVPNSDILLAPFPPRLAPLLEEPVNESLQQSNHTQSQNSSHENSVDHPTQSHLTQSPEGGGTAAISLPRELNGKDVMKPVVPSSPLQECPENGGEEVKDLVLQEADSTTIDHVLPSSVPLGSKTAMHGSSMSQVAEFQGIGETEEAGEMEATEADKESKGGDEENIKVNQKMDEKGETDLSGVMGTVGETKEVGVVKKVGVADKQIETGPAGGAVKCADGSVPMECAVSGEAGSSGEKRGRDLREERDSGAGEISEGVSCLESSETGGSNEADSNSKEKGDISDTMEVDETSGESKAIAKPSGDSAVTTEISGYSWETAKSGESSVTGEGGDSMETGESGESSVTGESGDSIETGESSDSIVPKVKSVSSEVGEELPSSVTQEYHLSMAEIDGWVVVGGVEVRPEEAWQLAGKRARSEASEDDTCAGWEGVPAKQAKLGGTLKGSKEAEGKGRSAVDGVDNLEVVQREEEVSGRVESYKEAATGQMELAPVQGE